MPCSVPASTGCHSHGRSYGEHIEDVMALALPPRHVSIALHRIASHRIASHCIASHCIALHRIQRSCTHAGRPWPSPGKESPGFGRSFVGSALNPQTRSVSPFVAAPPAGWFRAAVQAQACAATGATPSTSTSCGCCAWAPPTRWKPPCTPRYTISRPRAARPISDLCTYRCGGC